MCTRHQSQPRTQAFPGLKNDAICVYNRACPYFRSDRRRKKRKFGYSLGVQPNATAPPPSKMKPAASRKQPSRCMEPHFSGFGADLRLRVIMARAQRQTIGSGRRFVLRIPDSPEVVSKCWRRKRRRPLWNCKRFPVRPISHFQRYSVLTPMSTARRTEAGVLLVRARLQGA